ncbi:hypothetical protein AMECASPLE_028576, partial [Ameca splendens]
LTGPLEADSESGGEWARMRTSSSLNPSETGSGGASSSNPSSLGSEAKMRTNFSSKPWKAFRPGAEAEASPRPSVACAGAEVSQRPSVACAGAEALPRPPTT